jgi:hypothetical protein
MCWSGHHCNIFIGVRNIKEMPGSVASGTLCIKTYRLYCTAGGHTSAHPHTVWVQSWGISSGNYSQQSGTGAVLYDSLTPFLPSFHHYFISIYPLPYQVCGNTQKAAFYHTLVKGSIQNVPQILTCYKFLLKIQSVILPWERFFVKFLYLQTSFHKYSAQYSTGEICFLFRGISETRHIVLNFLQFDITYPST